MLGFFILLSPLIAAAVILLGTRKSGNVSAIIAVAAAAMNFVLAFFVKAGEKLGSFDWVTIGDFKLSIGLEVGEVLTKPMLFVVTGIGLLVQVFSLGYMKDDDGKARYFAGLSLFMFSMLGIVLADNFAMMFVFWELVGVSSFLLIGHWFQKNSAADAAKKAFLVNRIGDFGFMAGILILFGAAGTLNFAGLEEAVAAGKISGGMLTAAALCIFCGAIGKSAQVPLHIWLPDAMEGPTPVSALIHAATMVAAGVFMMAKVIFLVSASGAGEVISWIGAITALMAALMATQQDDIKKVLAYSTLSQLGYMILAIGFAASTAAFFHLFTHAFFKALLFLGSGAIIYACHHEQNIWKMGGLLKKMPKSAATFLIGTAALIAVPWITSGFYSKEAILGAAYSNPGVFWIAVFTAFLTAFYMTRLCIVVFFGKARSEGSDHAHEVPMVMLAPLLILSVPAIFAGFAFFGNGFGVEQPPHDPNHTIVLICSLVTLVAGVGAGFVLYKGKESEPLKLTLFKNKFYIDEIYIGLVRVFQDSVAYIAGVLDKLLIDGLAVGGITKLTSSAGSSLRKLQVGNLQGYAFLFGAGVILIIAILAAL
jgi:NADH-quinone oxidoreductase subunit L